jgi:Flp pilus assembly protein TadD
MGTGKYLFRGKSMSKYAFLRSNASLVIIGLIVGLAGGFKFANVQYRKQQSASLNRDIARATSGMTGAQAEITATIEKAKGNPNDAEAQVEAAFQFVQIERYQEAVPFLEQARKVDPSNRRATAGLGLAYFMLGRFDQAIDALKRSRDLGVNNPGVTSLLAGSYIQTGKNLDEAERLLKELETQKADPTQLAQLRADLEAARKGGAVKQSAAPSEKNGQAEQPRTTLSHGADEPKPSQLKGQSGGKN